MHRQHSKPACWTRDDTIRVPWAFDEGRACENFSTPALADHSLWLTPGCDGCIRAERAMQRWRTE